MSNELELLVLLFLIAIVFCTAGRTVSWIFEERRTLPEKTNENSDSYRNDDNSVL